MTRRDPGFGRCRLALLCGALLWFGQPAPACPVCDRETGRQVRAGLFDEDFGFNLAATMLPFAVFLAIAGAIHHEPGRANDAVSAPVAGQNHSTT